MKYRYKPETDALYIRIAEGKLDHAEQRGNIVLHYSKEDKLLELEILDASKETATLIQSMLKAKQSVAADSN